MSDIYLLAEIKAKPGKMHALHALLSELVTQSRQESACRAYDLYQDESDNQLFIMREIWTSADALEAHQNAPHFKAFVASAKESDALDSLVVRSLKSLA